SQVAQQLDFVSDSAFIVFFRQYTGTTPTRYLRHSIAEHQDDMSSHRQIRQQRDQGEIKAEHRVVHQDRFFRQ
ncbi:helix-turn-helix domain-containing protein, partial [Enterobacter sp. DRP3]|nr:helix-turn-helix domain-containing protein [Enterobacter sp. DRP3]